MKSLSICQCKIPDSRDGAKDDRSGKVETILVEVNWAILHAKFSYLYALWFPIYLYIRCDPERANDDSRG